jgi:hypothetical protein
LHAASATSAKKHNFTLSLLWASKGFRQLKQFMLTSDVGHAKLATARAHSKFD